jgi:hypothetical protein
MLIFSSSHATNPNGQKSWHQGLYWHALCKEKTRCCPRIDREHVTKSAFMRKQHNRRLTMKKALIVLLASLVVALALNVQAASVTFDPQAIELKVAPGQTIRTALTVHGFSSKAYSLNFLVGSRLENSNIPSEWLTAAYLWLDSRTEGGVSSRDMDLVVTVPPGAAPGKYSGLLVPDDMQCSEPITSPGVIVSIEVSDS